MKLRTILHTLLLAILCMGCGGHGHMRQLERLEAQLDTAPDAVRLALDSIPFASLGDEERALYAILRTQADYKCYVPLTTDTLIRHATNYYNRNRKSYRAAMAWYSLGCVYTELRDDVNAIHAYLQAKSFFPDTTTKYHAYCNQNLGEHYLNRNMFDEALVALEAFDKVATSESYDKEIRAASRLDVARIYMHKGLPEMAELTLKDAFQESLCIDTRAQIFFELGKIELVFYKNYDEAKEFFNKCTVGSTLLNKKEITEDKDFIFSSVEREQLYNILFNCFSTVVSNLYDEAKNLNDKEIIHCLLSSLNYSPHIIKACLVASSLNVIRMQKSRIKKKLPTDFYLLLFRN